MQFQVPQFIDTEDKVVGPLSLKQFAYIGTAAGICGALLFVLQLWLWSIIAIPILGVGSMLAFGKVNGRPISIYIRSLFQSIWAPSIYTFGPEITATPNKLLKPTPLPKVGSFAKPDLEGIKNLWVQMNTSKTAIPKREQPLPAQSQSFSQFKERFEAVRKITGEKEVAKRVDYR